MLAIFFPLLKLDLILLLKPCRHKPGVNRTCLRLYRAGHLLNVRVVVAVLPNLDAVGKWPGPLCDMR